MGTYIGRSPETELSERTSQLFNGNNTATSFALSNAVSDPKELDVYVNNVHQDPFNSYTVTFANSSINFSEAPTAGANNVLVVGRSRQRVGIFTVDDGSITQNKLATGVAIGDSLLTTTGVDAGTYGAENAIPVITVNDKGRVSNVVNVSVNIPVAFEAANALPTILLLSGM
jgi:hypothetical protein